MFCIQLIKTDFKTVPKIFRLFTSMKKFTNINFRNQPKENSFIHKFSPTELKFMKLEKSSGSKFGSKLSGLCPAYCLITFSDKKA